MINNRERLVRHAAKRRSEALTRSLRLDGKGKRKEADKAFDQYEKLQTAETKIGNASSFNPRRLKNVQKVAAEWRKKGFR